MSCLTDLISIKDPCNVTQSTGFYDITDISGFSFKSINNLTHDNFVRSYPFLQRILYKAKNQLLLDLQNVFTDYNISLNLSSQTQDTLGVDNNVYLPLTATSQWRGIVITSRDYNSHKKLHLKAITIQHNSTISTVLRIVDGGLIYNIPLNLVAGVPYVLTETDLVNILGQSFYATTNSIKILLDSSIVSVKSMGYTCPNCGGKGCANVIGHNGISNQVGESYGISAVVGCGCNFENIICELSNNHKELIAGLLLKRLEIEILLERIKSDRLNSYVIFGLEQAKEEYNLAITEYQDILKLAVKTMYLTISRTNFGGCVSCGAYNVKYNY